MSEERYEPFQDCKVLFAQNRALGIRHAKALELPADEWGVMSIKDAVTGYRFSKIVVIRPLHEFVGMEIEVFKDFLEHLRTKLKHDAPPITLI